MPGFTCCVPGCYNNSHRDRELRFYTFPKDPAQRELWLKNISRAGVSGCFSTFQPTTGHRVCSVHFSGGRKTYNTRVPTLFPLRGVNERKSRRGRGRGRKVGLATTTTVPPPAAAPASPTGGATTTIVITNVVSTATGERQGAETSSTGGNNSSHHTVVQIDQNGEYIGTASLPGGAQERTCYIAGAVVSSSTGATDPEHLSSGDAGAGIHVVQLDHLHTHHTVEITGGSPGPGDRDTRTIQYQLGVTSSPLDHSYSLTTGTTSAELLRKLNEQRDIIALMEVKMKEMKATVRSLRVTEAKLQEEVRERDRLLSAGAALGFNFNVRKKI